MRKAQTFLFYWLPFLIYIAFILTLSSQTSLPGSESINDKIAHTIEYAVFALLFCRALRLPGKGYPVHLNIAVFGGSAIFAAFDEFYQSYIPGRHSSRYDWYADIAGITIVFTLVLILRIKEQPATKL